MFMGIVGAETTSIHTQIVGLLFPLTEQHKNGFPSLERLGKMQKNVREVPSLLTGEKTASSNPKIMAPFFPFAKKHQKRILGMVKWRNGNKSWGRELSKLQLRERAQCRWEWVRNERCGCIMAWACISKNLLAPQLKNTFSKNGWLPKFEFDSHTLPIPMH